MIFRKIKYPSNNEEFYSFKNGVKIEDEQIEKWINEGIKSVKEQLEEGISAPYYYSGSGDTFVAVFFSQDIEEEVFADENYFIVIVARGYEEGTYFIEDLKENYYTEYSKVICSNFECPNKSFCKRHILNPNNRDLTNIDVREIQLDKYGDCDYYMMKDFEV